MKDFGYTKDGMPIIAIAVGEDGSGRIVLLPSGLYELRPSFWDEEGEPFPKYDDLDEAIKDLKADCGIG